MEPLQISQRGEEMIKIQLDVKVQKVCLWPRNCMGASFQAPHATPGQRLIEMHHVSLIMFIFQNASLTNHSGMYKLR